MDILKLANYFSDNGNEWKPHHKSEEILSRAMEHIYSVDYKVSVRWVFYRLLQDGLYNDKKGYKNFVNLSSRARHAFWNGWEPDLLADETRKPKLRGHGHSFDNLNVMSDIESRISTYTPWISHFYEQDNYVELLFEARAMAQQFEYYTTGITLCPFGGQPSIPYKWDIAKRIEDSCTDYDCEGIVLYFGDLDDAGLTIYETGERDIQSWCNVPVQFIRCGLTEEQVEKYNIPENPEHPGYQWEALTDEAAAEIINEHVWQFVDKATIDDTREKTGKIAQDAIAKVKEALKDLKE